MSPACPVPGLSEAAASPEPGLTTSLPKKGTPMAETNTQRDLEAEIKILKQDLGKLQADLRGIAETVVDTGRRTASDASDSVRQQVEQQLDTIHEHIQKKPVTTVAMAFGIGLLAGKLFGRK